MKNIILIAFMASSFFAYLQNNEDSKVGVDVEIYDPKTDTRIDKYKRNHYAIWFVNENHNISYVTYDKSDSLKDYTYYYVDKIIVAEETITIYLFSIAGESFISTFWIKSLMVAYTLDDKVVIFSGKIDYTNILEYYLKY